MDLGWSEVVLLLKLTHAWKKPLMHGNFLLIIQVRASVPHVRIWALLPFDSFSSLSMMSAQ